MARTNSNPPPANSGGKESSVWSTIGKIVLEGAVEGTIIKWILSHAMATVDRKVEGKVRRERNKLYFAAAMVKLRQRDSHAADVIEHFNDHWLDDDTDREDFQHNAAGVGTDADDKMDDTVQFLYDLAQLPTHDDREVRITALGFIGARSVDMAEKATALLVAVAEQVTNLPDEAKKWIERRKTTLGKLDSTPAVTKMAAHAKTTRSKWEDKLKTRRP